MKDAIVLNETVACYQDTDLADPAFQSIRATARTIWAKRCEEYLAKNGASGSIVVGAGFSVWYLAPRARTARRRIILSPPNSAQGSLVWEDSEKEIEQVFRDAGVDVHYEWGRMD